MHNFEERKTKEERKGGKREGGGQEEGTGEAGGTAALTGGGAVPPGGPPKAVHFGAFAPFSGARGRGGQVRGPRPLCVASSFKFIILLYLIYFIY